MEEQEYHEEGHNPEYEELLLLYNHVQGHSKSLLVVAEREGFEPSERYKRSLPFQGSAIDHSAISPKLGLYLNS